MVGGRNETAIDTSLITCGEYQLFLDETRLMREAYQPDHWKDTCYISGQADIPVTGVRRSDAQAFCHWLTKRETRGWRYRLPRQGEADLESVKEHLPDGWDKLIGHWEIDKNAFFWILLPERDQTEKDEITGQPSKLLDLDWYRQVIEGNILVPVEIIARVNSMSTNDFSSARDLIHKLARSLDHDLANALAFTSGRTNNPNLVYYLSIANTLARDLVSSFASLITDGNIRTNTLARTYKNAASNIRDLIDNLVRVSVSACNLASDLARGLVTTRDFASSTNNLASASASARDLAHASLIACDLGRLDVPLQSTWMAFAHLFALLSISIARLDQAYEIYAPSTHVRWKRFWRYRYPVPPMSSSDTRISGLTLRCVEQILRRQDGKEHSCEGILLVKEPITAE
jgi:hypothetical protein